MARTNEDTLDRGDLPSPYTPPPGLLGAVAQFVYGAAPRPVPEIALAGAVAILAGIVGRAYNVCGLGLNLYVMLLAPTGSGKEAISSGLTALMKAVSRSVPASTDFIGPAAIASAPALVKHLSNIAVPSFVSILGEFGKTMQQMANPRAPAHLVDLLRILLALYSLSGRNGELRPSIYSDREKNTKAVQSPALSIVGESTPESFYGGLNEGFISDGLLTRFSLFEYHGKRVASNPNRVEVPPQELVEHMATLCAHALMLNGQGQVQDVALSELAQVMFDEFDIECDANINSATNEVTRHLWNRAHIKAMKLAALVAVGCDPYHPTVNSEHATWAIQIEKANVRNLLTRFESGDVGDQSNSETAQQSKVRKVIAEWMTKSWDELSRYKVGSPAMRNDYVIPYSFISKRLTNDVAFKKDGGATQKVKRAIDELIKCGELARITPKDAATKYNTRMECYIVTDIEQFKHRAVQFF